MGPAQLIGDTRRRKGLSQRRLALRAGTSQSAIARIEAGAEEVTWPRLGALMISMGEEPVLSARPLASRYDAADLLRDRASSPELRLSNGVEFNEFATKLAIAAQRARQMEQAESPLRLDEILRTLVEFGVEFVVVGGVAVQAHGYLRGTGDLDIVPKPTVLNLSRLAEALADLGATPWRATLPVDVTDPQLLESVPLVPLATRHGRLDVLNIAHTSGAPGSFEELMERALVVDLDGLSVAIAGIDDLLRMKRAAGRPQDLTDIGALARSDEELEREAREST